MGIVTTVCRTDTVTHVPRSKIRFNVIANCFQVSNSTERRMYRKVGYRTIDKNIEISLQGSVFDSNGIRDKVLSEPQLLCDKMTFLWLHICWQNTRKLYRDATRMELLAYLLPIAR
jgi:hypothetical protein